MYSTPVDLSFSYLRSAVEASLDIKKDQVDPNISNKLIISVSATEAVFCYTAEKSHHLKAQVHQKIRSFKRSKYQQEEGREVK